MEGGDGARLSTNPTRDLAHIWPFIVNAIEPGLAQDRWEPWFADYLKFYPVSEADLQVALAGLFKGLALAIEPGLDDPGKTIKEAGFLGAKPAAQHIVLSKVGQLTYGAFWSGIKSANPQGEVPRGLGHLLQRSEQMLRAVRQAWRAPGLWGQGVAP
jgi:hypothetical protein